MEVPPNAICLEQVKDLFYPNKDTKQKCPHKILVISRPGIGKTVLTEKILLVGPMNLIDFIVMKSLYT